jgi:hypothetical protein
MPETRLFRRAVRNGLADTLHILLVAFLFCALMFALREAVQSQFRNIWIDLQSVAVPDHIDGEDPTLTVDRIIHRDFPGSWEVRIRRAYTHELIDVAKSTAKIDYRKVRSQENPIHPYLSDWLRDSAALAHAESEGFGEGRFYIRTCHIAYVAGFLPFDRCVDSNVFERFPKGS